VLIVNALAEMTAVMWLQNWQALLLLTLFATLAQLFKAETTDHQLYYTTLVFFFAGVVLLPPPLYVVLVTVPMLVEWARERFVRSQHLRDWYLQPFNITVHVLSGLGAQWVYYSLLDEPGMLLGLWFLLAPLAAAIFYNLFNHVLIGLALVLARGVSLQESGILDVSNLITDLILLLSGEMLALVWEVSPWLTLLALAPLVLIYRALTIPRLERQAQTDAKTGVWNAGYFNESLEEELARANRFNRPLSLIMGDLDLLRRINNNFGHIAGDAALQGVARVMRDLAREYDVVARFGGEEFAVLMPEASLEEAQERAEHMRQRIAETVISVPTSVEPIRVTISMGVASRREGEGKDSLVHRADLALYQAKEHGRNRVYVHGAEGVIVPAVEGLAPASGGAATNGARGEYPIVSAQRSTSAAVSGSPAPAVKQAGVPPHAPQGAESDRDRSPQPYSVRVRDYPTWAVQLYVTALTVFAGLLAFLLLPLSPRPDLGGLLLFAIIVVGIEALSVEIYVQETTISTSAAPLIGGVMLFGPIAAIVLAPVIAIVARVKQRSPWNRLLFNFSNHLLGGLIVSVVFLLSGQPIHEWSLGVQLGLTLVAGSVLFFVTTLFLSGAIVLDRGLPFDRIWSERFRWLWPYYLALGVVAFALAFSYDRAGFLGIVVILVPLLMLRYSQTQYIDRTEKLVHRLRTTNVELRRQTEEVELLNEELLLTLARATDLRDPFVLEHSKHVARYAAMTAAELGLGEESIENIRKAGLLHDIGKLGIPESILFKPARLTDEEYELVKEHVIVGADLVHECHSLHNLISIIKHHHERYDGRGYPEGLAAESIPLEARILGLADAVEAMASDRPYKKARTADEILEEIHRCSGTQFDPLVVDAFTRIVERQGSTVIINSARAVMEAV
jgi:diguanylate cyclase (GGDEF)-like protein/putative nucleotidyltransferase with HDIG domain